jgi:hypothetical protein
MSSAQEEEDAKVVKDLQALARHVDGQLPYGLGFVVLAFPFGAGGRMNYISNAQRADVVRAMYEFIEATKEKWAEHEPELGAAAEDEQLGRSRQQISELKRLLTHAADALEAPAWEWHKSWALAKELRKAAQ